MVRFTGEAEDDHRWGLAIPNQSITIQKVKAPVVLTRLRASAAGAFCITAGCTAETTERYTDVTGCGLQKVEPVGQSEVVGGGEMRDER